MSFITFMIGNGFDLACGLKSKYSDSYYGYINSPSSSDVIDRFKKTIKNDIDSWADFEMKLAEYAHTFNSESELIECISDYRAYLTKYLRQEQTEFINRERGDSNLFAATIAEVRRSLGSFYSGLTPNDRRAIMESISDNTPAVYQFVNFNYTSVFDELINEVFGSPIAGKGQRNRPVIHIHGSLDNDVVLGVDNRNQLSGLTYPLGIRGTRNVVKPVFIEQYDIERKNKAISYIQSSKVVCVFGLSLGESDLTWKKAIAAWLMGNRSNHLVFYIHSLATKKYADGEIAQRMDDEEEAKDKLLKKLFGETIDENKYHQLFKQIHIPAGSNIFNLSNVSYTVVKGAEVSHPPLGIT